MSEQPRPVRVGIILSTETESRSGALTPSGVVTRHRRSGDVRSLSHENLDINNPEWLRDQYATHSLSAVARMAGVTRCAIRRRLTLFGIPIRTPEDVYAESLRVRAIVVVGDGSALVPLTRGYVAVIDETDIPLVAGRRWYVNGKKVKYAESQNRAKEERLRMHRVIIGAPDGVPVDHIDGDGLNNRRANLRLATVQENGANSRHQVGATGFRGVRLTKTGRFEAYISGHSDYVYLGTFDSAEEAAAVRDIAALQRYGEFAVLNLPESEAA